MSADLTARQRQALSTIHGHLVTHQRPPTLRELGKALGIRSTNAVSELLAALEKKGVIQRDAGIPRGIRVLKTG